MPSTVALSAPAPGEALSPMESVAQSIEQIVEAALENVERSIERIVEAAREKAELWQAEEELEARKVQQDLQAAREDCERAIAKAELELDDSLLTPELLHWKEKLYETLAQHPGRMDPNLVIFVRVALVSMQLAERKRREESRRDAMNRERWLRMKARHRIRQSQANAAQKASKDAPGASIQAKAGTKRKALATLKQQSNKRARLDATTKNEDGYHTGTTESRKYDSSKLIGLP